MIGGALYGGHRYYRSYGYGYGPYYDYGYYPSYAYASPYYYGGYAGTAIAAIGATTIVGDPPECSKAARHTCRAAFLVGCACQIF